MAYTTPPTAVAGQTLTASDWNTKVRDSLEAVAKPGRCKVTRAAALSIPNNATTAIVFDNQVYDTASIWGPGAPTQLIAPENAIYTVKFTIQFAIHATGIRQFNIAHSGSNIATANIPATAAGFVGVSLSVDESAAAGEIFTFTAFQNSGGSLALDVTTAQVSASLRLVSR